MSGMYTICTYSRFSITDSTKFERRLTKWCKTECMPRQSMLIFDRDKLKIEEVSEVKKQNGQEFYQVTMANISFSYFCISAKMCIMSKVWENKTRSVIYNMPSQWDKTELWLGD